MSKIIQIIPQLPPSVNGLGDYALNLARQLRQDFDIETHFIVGDPSWTGARQIEDFSISKVTAHKPSNLLSILANYSSTILLHYVGYGYAKRGCPKWLVDGLQIWRTANSQRRLVIMFHEIYAFGPVWTSSFWLSSLQKNLAARLTKVSDRCLTSMQKYAEILHHLSQNQQNFITNVPVFSTIGEPQFFPPLAKRSRQLIMFGRQHNRLQVYQHSLKALKQVCQALAIEKIYDIGIPTGLNLSKLTQIPIVEMGVMQAEDLSNLLLQSIAGFCMVPPSEFLAKSTIFAAYCAHGMIPISTRASSNIIDGLEASKHYWVVDDYSQQISLDVAQKIADHAHAWYQTHSLSIQAKIFATHLEHLA